MTQVFISYSRKDQAFVERLVVDLKKAGLDVWYDLSGLEGGSRWRAEIQNAIKNSQYVIVVLSLSSVESEWVEREFLFASNLKLKIIPLIYKQCELPMNYLNLNFIDVQGNNYRQNFGEILEALNIQQAAGSLPKKTPGNIPFTLKTRYVLAIVGVFAIILIARFGSPLIAGWFSPEPLPTVPSILTPVITATLTQTSPAVTSTNTPLPTLSSTLWITYTSDLNGNRDIFELNPATGESRAVLSDPSHDKVGTWSPVGKFLAFESNRNSTIYYQIYLFDSEQGIAIRLTELAMCSNWSPAWSPDGAKIVFYSNCDNGQRNIYMMNRDGSGRKKLTSSSGENRFPAFSPDGNNIAFTSTRNNKDQIWLMNIDGSNQRFVADGCSSTFSPDGKWLWFSSICDDSDIKHIRINGTNLSTIGAGFGHNPSESPDGLSVVFQSNEDIWVMGVDGSNLTRLTSGSAVDGAPSWKP